jgi:chromosome segregation ATPase
MIYQIGFFLLLLGGAGAYYWHSEHTIENLRENNTKLEVSLQSAQEEITQYVELAKAQRSALSALEEENQEINTEIDRYLAIFRRHDLNKLAEAKPGLIESRINSGTAQVFEEIENETNNRNNLSPDSRM